MDKVRSSQKSCLHNATVDQRQITAVVDRLSGSEVPKCNWGGRGLLNEHSSLRIFIYYMDELRKNRKQEHDNQVQPVHSGTPKPKAARRKEKKRLAEEEKKKKRKLRIERPIARSYIMCDGGCGDQPLRGGIHPGQLQAKATISRSQGTTCTRPAERWRWMNAALRALQ